MCGGHCLEPTRYDIRNRLEDKAQFGLKPILPRRRTEEEEELDEMLDQERYLALGVDILEQELLEGDYIAFVPPFPDSLTHSLSLLGCVCLQKSPKRGIGRAVVAIRLWGLPTETVNLPSHSQHLSSYHHITPAHNTLPRQLLTCWGAKRRGLCRLLVSWSQGASDRYINASVLTIDCGYCVSSVPQPVTKKLHSIIERTAGFVARQGTQMEIMIRAKQKYNPLFSFLSLYDPLYSYYRHLLQLISSGEYTPRVEEGGGGEESEGGGKEKERRAPAVRIQEEAEKEGSEDGSDSGDSDDEEFELHPLLRISTTPRSSPRPPSTKNVSGPPTTTTNGDHAHTPPPPTVARSSFYSKSLTVNAAPSLEVEQGGGAGTSRRTTHHHPHPPSAER